MAQAYKIFETISRFVIVAIQAEGDYMVDMKFAVSSPQFIAASFAGVIVSASRFAFLSAPIRATLFCCYCTTNPIWIVATLHPFGHTSTLTFDRAISSIAQCYLRRIESSIFSAGGARLNDFARFLLVLLMAFSVTIYFVFSCRSYAKFLLAIRTRLDFSGGFSGPLFASFDQSRVSNGGGAFVRAGFSPSMMIRGLELGIAYGAYPCFGCLDGLLPRNPGVCTQSRAKTGTLSVTPMFQVCFSALFTMQCYFACHVSTLHNIKKSLVAFWTCAGVEATQGMQQGI